MTLDEFIRRAKTTPQFTLCIRRSSRVVENLVPPNKTLLRGRKREITMALDEFIRRVVKNLVPPTQNFVEDSMILSAYKLYSTFCHCLDLFLTTV